jgi:hypothetical protein
MVASERTAVDSARCHLRRDPARWSNGASEVLTSTARASACATEACTLVEWGIRSAEAARRGPKKGGVVQILAMASSRLGLGAAVRELGSVDKFGRVEVAVQATTSAPRTLAGMPTAHPENAPARGPRPGVLVLARLHAPEGHRRPCGCPARPGPAGERPKQFFVRAAGTPSSTDATFCTSSFCETAAPRRRPSGIRRPMPPRSRRLEAPENAQDLR